MPEDPTRRPDPVELEGSERGPAPGARRVADADPDEAVLVSVIVRRRPGATLPAPNAAGGAPARQAARRAFAAVAGADPADLEAVAAFASAAGLRVVRSDAAQRTVVLGGSVAPMGAAFGVSLGRYEVDGGGSYRGREGSVRVPADLAGIVEAVLGLDDRPQARAHFRLGDPIPEPAPDAAAPAGAPKATPLWATRVAALYDFPTGTGSTGAALDGAGETIGIIELGGGYRPSDLSAYFAKAGRPEPTVVAVPVGTGANTPGGAADGEVALDIEVAGSVAPGAEIVVYFTDSSDRGFLEAITTAVHDRTHAPSVITISWGGPEVSWTAQSRTAFDSAFADAAALGVTVLCAAGDHGAGDAAGQPGPHVDFPASSPHVVACGGTTLVASANAIESEVVWNDGDGWAGGGGISAVFPVPAWQAGVALPANLGGSGRAGRGVPDVAGNADITSGYIVVVDGTWNPVGGTSAVAPLYAGLTALLNQAPGAPVGALAPRLYAVPAGAGVFRDVTTGDNAVPASQYGPATTGYRAAPGWDACTGWGSIDGRALLAHLAAAKPPA